MAQIAGAADNVETRAGGHAFTPGWPVAAENRVSVGRAVGLRDRLPGVSDRTRRGETAFPAVVHAGSGVGRHFAGRKRSDALEKFKRKGDRSSEKDTQPTRWGVKELPDISFVDTLLRR